MGGKARRPQHGAVEQRAEFRTQTSCHYKAVSQSGTVSRCEASYEALDRVTLLAIRGFVRSELDEPGSTEKALEELDHTPNDSTLLTLATAA